MIEANDISVMFEDYIQKKELIKKNNRIIVGFSAGADSTALLYLLHELRTKYNLSLLAVHINYQLRSAESDADEEHAKALCRNFNVPIIVRKVNLEHTGNLENQARNIRFKIFGQILDMYKFDLIALAHTNNDQIETVFMNMLRGSGITGLGGIKPKTNNIIHPLLFLTKNDVINLLQVNKIKWREDSSNAINVFKRNVIRNEFIPKLTEAFGNNIHQKIFRQSDILQQTDEYMWNSVKQTLKKITTFHSNEEIILGLSKLKRLSEIEQYYCFKIIVFQLTHTDNDFYHHNVKQITSLLTVNGTKILKLAHNLIVIKQYEEIIFTTNIATILPVTFDPIKIDDDRALAVFGNYRFNFKQLKIKPDDFDFSNDSSSILIDAAKIKFPLYIRTRQPGDRFFPTGSQFPKKVKEFFIDEKIPKFDRDKIPILLDEENIIWIVGYRLDNRVLCTDDTNRFLLVTSEMISTGRKRSAHRKTNGVTNEFNEL